VSMTDTAKAIVDDVFKDLRTRKGFNWWWDDIDEDIQDEIRSDLHDVVFRHLENMG